MSALHVYAPTRGCYRVLAPTPTEPYWRTEAGEHIGWQELRSAPRLTGDLAATTTVAVNALVGGTIVLELAGERRDAIALPSRTQLLIGEIVGRVSPTTRQPAP